MEETMAKGTNGTIPNPIADPIRVLEANISSRDA